MKRVFLHFTLLLLLISNYCYSQTGGFGRTLRHTGNDYHDVSFFNENIVVMQRQEAGTIVKTTNGGNNWFLVNQCGGDNFTSV